MSVSEDGHWLYGIKECSSRKAPGWFAILLQDSSKSKNQNKTIMF